MMTKEKIVEPESLRGLAALSVVAAHIPPWNGDFFEINFVRNAGGMVEFFFVLSGFVIALTYNERIVKVSDAVRFQFLRFGRLYPVHLLFLLVVAGFEVVKLPFVRDPVSPAFAPGFTGPREFVENLFSFKAWHFQRSRHPLTVRVGRYRRSSMSMRFSLAPCCSPQCGRTSCSSSSHSHRRYF